jgi:YHS domain-containing protein
MRAVRILAVAAALTAFLAAAGAAPTERSATPARPQSSCPVSGKPVDRTIFTTYEGQKISFCCPKCVAPFLKNPETFLAKLGEQGQVVESQQTLCPVSGDAIDAKVSVDDHGRRVFFCCAMCIKEFQGDPAKYLPLLGRTTAPAGGGMPSPQAAPKGGRHDGRAPGDSGS